MSDFIFKSADEKVKFENGIYSFNDCPNHCVDGFTFDPYTHKKVKCAYCEEKRKKIIKEGIVEQSSSQSIDEILNLPRSLSGYNFDIESVFPPSALKVLEPESVEKVKKQLQELMTKISVGELPDHSYLFNLGIKACENNFIYPYIMRAYIEGIKVAPFVTSYDISYLRRNEEIGYETDYSFTYSDLINKELCVISIDAGAQSSAILAVKGLMYLRANKGYPTIIFTNVWNRNVTAMQCEDDMKLYHLAELFSIQYTQSYLSRESKYVDNNSDSSKGSAKMTELSQEQFNKLFSH